MKKIAIIIPCLNEEEGLARVIKEVPHKKLGKLGYKAEILVIDNGSTDRTVEVAREGKVKVFTEKRKGKGFAVRNGFKKLNATVDFVVMIDGDNTYKISEVDRLIEPLTSGFTDVVIGSRLKGKIIDGSFKISNKLVNYFLTFFIRNLYKRANVTDAMSGFVVWKYPVIKKLSQFLESGGFAIETEMIAKTDKLGFSMHSVPITYDKRVGKAKIKVWDFFKIVYAIAAYMRWSYK